MTEHDLDQLMSQLLSDDAILTQRAAQAIAQQETPATAAALPLLQAISSPHLDTMEWAISALEDLGAPDSKDLQSLILVLEDYRHRRVLAEQAYWAITLIGRLRFDAEPAIETLLAVLEFSDELPVKEKAIWALGQIGPSAQAARPTLTQLSSSDQPRISRLALQALASLDA